MEMYVVCVKGMAGLSRRERLSRERAFVDSTLRKTLDRKH